MTNWESSQEKHVRLKREREISDGGFREIVIYGLVIAGLLIGGILLMERNGIQIEIKSKERAAETAATPPQIISVPETIQSLPPQFKQPPAEEIKIAPRQKSNVEIYQEASKIAESSIAENTPPRQTSNYDAKSMALSQADHFCDTYGQGLIQYRECRSNKKKELLKACRQLTSSFEIATGQRRETLRADREFQCYVADNFQIVETTPQ